MSALKDTIRAAEIVLGPDTDIELRILNIENYVVLLDRLFEHLEVAETRYSAEELGQLEPLHQRVMALAVQLLGATSVDLQQLQSKGKAILAYTDTMPKRVSIRTKKKG